MKHSYLIDKRLLKLVQLQLEFGVIGDTSEIIAHLNDSLCKL